MTARRTYTDADISEVCRLYEVERLSTPKVAARLGFPVGSIRSLLKRGGVETRSTGEGRRILSPQQEQQAIALYIEEQLSTPDIGKRFNCSSCTINYVLKRHNIKVRTNSEAGQLQSAKKAASEASRRKDLTGQRFGKLTVIGQGSFRERINNHGKVKRRLQWKCLCDCGNTIERAADALRGGKQKSCGCAKKEVGRYFRKPMVGLKFNRLTVLELLEERWGNWTPVYRCLCDCGNETKTCGAFLRKGHTKSCGKCLSFGDASISAILNGTFHEPERDSEFYVYAMSKLPEHFKPGIDSTGNRATTSLGEYGEQLLSIELPRVEAWLLEQAVLHETRLMTNWPQRMEKAQWAGRTELRRMDPDALLAIATNLHDQLLDLGRIDFALQCVPMTIEQATQFQALRHRATPTSADNVNGNEKRPHLSSPGV